ncbi:MAG: hypothetical protein IJD51_02305 [Clostridia bacterium]|nr:hypothetical protein [Clostridia bacterium]
MNRDIAKRTVEEFLSFPISTGEDILRKFGALGGAIMHLDGEMKNFVYVPGSRADRVLLVAHVDTVWDYEYELRVLEQGVREKRGVFSGKSRECGIGADDRAGCAMLWMLRDSGHSLLLVDGEECGQIGSNHIRSDYPEIFDELNGHSYMIQLDRREHRNYKVYNLPVSDEFIDFVEGETGFYNAGRASRTDIIVLCRDVCGVNLSIGYYNEHTSSESLNFDEWFSTLELVERILAKKQERYPLIK